MNAEAEGCDRPPIGAPPWARTVLDRTRQLVALIDPGGLLLDASSTLLAAIGTDRAGLVGRPLESAPRWRDSPTERTQLRAAIERAAAGEQVRYEVQAERPGSEPESVIIDVELTPLHGADGTVSTILIEGRDVTGYRVAQAAALASAEAARAAQEAAKHTAQLQLGLDAAGMALWSWDVVHDRISWSGRSDRVLGLPASPSGTDAAIGRRVHPDDRARMRSAIRDALAGRELFDLEFRVLRADGGVQWLLGRGRMQRDATGRPVSLDGVVIDVTERAAARVEHNRLLQAERRASRRAAALQRITAALSEAATCEQVAAVIAEESLRTLGADAARVDLVAPQPIGGPGPAQVGHVVRTAGQARLLDGGTARPAADATGVLVQADPLSTRVTLTLTSRGRRRGRWLIAWRPAGPAESAGPAEPLEPRPEWTEPDGLDLLRTLATECAQALDRAELYEQQRDIATVLQRTLLPAGLPTVAGATVAARYQPGGQGVDVGGDWYDVISLPDGRTGLVIGDVEGHSAVAAAVMGQVRNALRAYAVEGSTPAIVMERLNRLLTRLQIVQLVTCCYLEFAPSEGTATVVLAGHPAPLVVRPDGSCDYVRAPANLLLGVDESATYLETTVLLDPGACLLLFTDGLVETVSRSLPAGLEALRGWATGWQPEDSPDELVETLIRRAREGRTVLDDVAVLALRYTPVRRSPGTTRSVRRTFPLDPASASAARRFVTDVLSQWGYEDLSYQVTLMTSELVTNSVLHTSGELELGLRLERDRVRVEVVDRSERLPALQHPDDDAPGGRGLLIISALAHTWGVEGRGDGKAVWFEVLLGAPRPVGGPAR